MLVSFAEEKTGECVVCCHRCGAFLMESASTTSYMVCPECGARLVVMVKKGKVSVFNDTRSEEELAKTRHARLTRYAAKINKITEILLGQKHGIRQQLQALFAMKNILGICCKVRHLR